MINVARPSSQNASKTHRSLIAFKFKTYVQLVLRESSDVILRRSSDMNMLSTNHNESFVERQQQHRHKLVEPVPTQPPVYISTHQAFDEFLQFIENEMNTDEDAHPNVTFSNEAESGRLTNDTYESLMSYRTESFAEIAGYSLIALVGTVMNTYVLTCMLRTRRRSKRRGGSDSGGGTSLRVLVEATICADLFTCLTTALIQLVWNIYIRWTLGEAACKLFMFLEPVGPYASGLCIAFIAVEQAVVVLKPFHRSSSRNRQVLYAVIGWAVALVSATPNAVFFIVLQHPDVHNFSHCTAPAENMGPFHPAYHYFSVTVFAFIPFLIILLSYLAIAFGALAKRSNIDTASTTNTKSPLSVPLQPLRAALDEQQEIEPRSAITYRTRCNSNQLNSSSVTISPSPSARLLQVPTTPRRQPQLTPTVSKRSNYFQSAREQHPRRLNQMMDPNFPINGIGSQPTNTGKLRQVARRIDAVRRDARGKLLPRFSRTKSLMCHGRNGAVNDGKAVVAVQQDDNSGSALSIGACSTISTTLTTTDNKLNYHPRIAEYHNQMRRRFYKLALTVSAVFLSCRLPYAVIVFLNHFGLISVDDASPLTAAFQSFLHMFAIVNAVVDPFLFRTLYLVKSDGKRANGSGTISGGGGGGGGGELMSLSRTSTVRYQSTTNDSRRTTPSSSLRRSNRYPTIRPGGTEVSFTQDASSFVSTMP